MPDNLRMPRDAPPANIRERPPLGVEVHDDSTLLRSRLALTSNWFHKHVRVTPGDVRLEVVNTSSGFARACRVDLVSGLIETELALGFLVYFLAELEAACRDTT